MVSPTNCFFGINPTAVLIRSDAPPDPNMEVHHRLPMLCGVGANEALAVNGHGHEQFPRPVV